MPHSETCPYGAISCPKVEELDRELQHVKKTMDRILRGVYFTAGLLAVEFGVVVI